MILEQLMTLICDEFGLDRDDIDKTMTLDSLVSDEFEMQALVEAIEGEFEITLDETPADEWTVEELADAISSAS